MRQHWENLWPQGQCSQKQPEELGQYHQSHLAWEQCSCFVRCRPQYSAQWGWEGKGMLNHQGTPSVLVPWAYNFVKQNLISFEGNSNAAQWLTLHSFCCAFHGLGLVGKMLSSSASVLRGFCLIGLKAFSLHFTPQPSFHPSQRTGKRSWSFISKEKGVAMGLSNGHVQWAWRARSSVVLFVFPTGFDRTDSILWGFQHGIMSSKSSCLFNYIRFMLAWNSLGVREANLSLFNVL